MRSLVIWSNRNATRRGDSSNNLPGVRCPANLLGQGGQDILVSEEGQVPREIGGKSAWAATAMAMRSAPGPGTPPVRQP